MSSIPFFLLLAFFNVAKPLSQTCQVSRNFREYPEMEHDLQVSRKCYKISRNLGNLIDLIFFCKKACFGCESERSLV